MYSKFLTTIYAADSSIDDALFKIQSELHVNLSDGRYLNLFTFSKESDDSYTIFFRYIPGVTFSDLIKPEKIFSIDSIPDKIQLGRILIDTDKARNSVIDSNISGLVQVEGYLDAVDKETFAFANTILDYIVKSLQDLLKGKYVVTFKKPFDISKEVKQVNKKWKGTEYDAGIYKILEKIQSFCRVNFLNSVKDQLISNGICTLIGFKKYESVISKEYSIVSDAYFESDEFKRKVGSYVHELNLQKDNENFDADLEDKLTQLTSFDSNNYIDTIKKKGDFGVNEYPLVNLAFTPEIQNEVKSYINDSIASVFTKREANLYQEFFSRIAITKEEIEDLKNKQKAEKEFIKFEDLLSDEEKQSLQNVKTDQETQVENTNGNEKKDYYDKSLEYSQLTDQSGNNGERLSLEDAIKDYADNYGYTVEYKEGTDKPSKVTDESGHRVNVTDFMNAVKREYDLADSVDEIGEKLLEVETSIYDTYLTPESYSQFHSRASVILAQLTSIDKKIRQYFEDAKRVDNPSALNDIYNKIKVIIIKAVGLPKGIQKSLLSALNVSNVRVGLEQLQMVLDVQIQIIKIFIEDTDYKSARGRVNAVLNEYRDLSRYFSKQVENTSVSQDVKKVIEDTKDRPYLLAKKFRMYLKQLGWKYDSKDLVFYQVKGKQKQSLSNDELSKLLEEFNTKNKSDLKLEDIFVQRNLVLEPIDIVIKNNSITKSLFNNIDEIVTNSGIKDLNNKLDQLSLEIKNL